MKVRRRDDQRRDAALRHRRRLSIVPQYLSAGLTRIRAVKVTGVKGKKSSPAISACTRGRADALDLRRLRQPHQRGEPEAPRTSPPARPLPFRWLALSGDVFQDLATDPDEDTSVGRRRAVDAHSQIAFRARLRRGGREEFASASGPGFGLLSETVDRLRDAPHRRRLGDAVAPHTVSVSCSDHEKDRRRRVRRSRLLSATHRPGEGGPAAPSATPRGSRGWARALGRNHAELAGLGDFLGDRRFDDRLGDNGPTNASATRGADPHPRGVAHPRRAALSADERTTGRPRTRDRHRSRVGPALRSCRERGPDVRAAVWLASSPTSTDPPGRTRCRSRSLPGDPAWYAQHQKNLREGKAQDAPPPPAHRRVSSSSTTSSRAVERAPTSTADELPRISRGQRAELRSLLNS